MKFKHNVLYTALFASASFNLFAQEPAKNSALDEVSVVSELEKFKATEKLKADVNLSLLGRQLAFLSPITVVNYDEKAFADKEPRNIVDVLAKTDASVMNFGGETGQPHMLSIFQPTRRATAHLEIHLTNRQRSISLSYSAFRV
ncbi:hypothetical protein Q7469_12215 [Glaesserella parasuis]|uniref:Uncharacterized protein n=1 Tax=Glaesserella parasuis TaxID=738 RepID=A0AAJ6D9X7_GLAPU|nr:hypothetical protein [Glaesserella parasuis]MCT8574876.1 hypothetical protein [Glaesserella parasuis]MCT8655862.1 hypothetical protein [Glaesserella parasuis]MCT8837599.1 hypothetical protein [Glaesserella parasuis]MDD2166980.1 hypothetical protein [Glaesserella parasuis]MDG6450940.1 hypothetical protein [Glaesserella parasuis]